MKKIAALLISIALFHPQEALMPLVLAAETSADKAVAGERVSLDKVDVGEDSVRLQLSAPARYNAFAVSNPPRVVLEIFNTELNVSNKNDEGKGLYLKRIRSGQFVGDPDPITRVVLELSQTVPFKVVLNGDRIEVNLNAAGTQSPSSIPNSLAQAPGATQPSSPVAAAPASPSAPKAASAPKAPSAAKAVSPVGEEMSTETSSELETFVEENSSSRQIPEADARNRSVPRPASGGKTKRDIMATLPRDLITLELDGTDVEDILKLLAAKAGLNIIHGTDVNGTLSLHLTDVPFNEAFNIILSMKGLVASQVGNNILRVMTPAALTKERTDTIGMTRVFRLNYKKATEVKVQVDAVRAAEKRTGNSVADDVNNILIVTEAPEGLAATERLLAQIDIRPQQVLIEAKLVEVGLSKDMAMGIQWDYLGQFPSGQGSQHAVNAIGSAANPLTNTNPAAPANLSPFDKTATASVGAAGRGTGVFLPASNAFGAFTFGRITNNYFLTATLTAAATEGKVKVLSDPKIATLNGKQATINIQTQTPYVTTNATPQGGLTQQVSYTTTGIQLSVTPTITADGRINLQVKPNVSKPAASAATAGGAIAVDSRQADTNVLVRDGETIVIGGLITDSVNNTIAKIPLLGDIPILGWLFKKKTVTRSRVELLIFVTTKIMPD